MAILVHPPFLLPVGDDAALVPRTPAIADAYHELLLANWGRLAASSPWRAADPPDAAHTRTRLEVNGHAWVEGRGVPVAVALRANGGWRLVGAAGLNGIDTTNRTAELGFWIDAGHESRGLVTRAATALLDHAFGALGLARVSMHTVPGNERSRAVARRLGFTEEARHRSAVALGGTRHDIVVYAMLAPDWPSPSL